MPGKMKFTVVPFGAVKFDGLYVIVPPAPTKTLMLFAFELLVGDGAAEEEVAGPLPPYCALTIIGRNTAVNARENFMVVDKVVS